MKLKITDIEVIPIYPRLAQRYESRRVDLYGIDARTVFKVHTDAGLVGYGDQRVRPAAQPDPECARQLIGQSPFDLLNNRLSLGSALSCALYDVMGKFLEIPVYKLLGPQVRDHVTVAAWTRPASPEQFRDEILRAVAQGYMTFKMHSCDYHDIFAQTRLASEVAPPGFRIHWDFNHNRNLATVLPIIKELERDYPIVAYIEDPLVKEDLDGWRELRRKTNLPLIMHGTPLGGMQEVILGLSDMYMVGGAIGDTLVSGLALGKANIPVILQFEGGTLGKAMAMHLASVLPTHTAHSINLDDQYEEDITTERIPVFDGCSPVPDRPGLGYEVDEAALSRLAAGKLVEAPRHVGVLHMPSGATYYGKTYVSPSALVGRQEGSVRGFRSELWEEDGSAEFERMHEKVQAQGTVRAD
jgi:L-alanine-DL-glutamate epimerase-like enolase superfamily enzyme